MAKVAWLGLGVMGYPMAGHLKTRGGHDVIVYNRSAQKAEKWRQQFGGETASTPAEAARDCDVVFACVGNDADVRRALLTFAIVGGGPTGVELAGNLAEIARHTLKHEFRRIDPRESRVLLLEAGPRVLSSFPESLSAKARAQLERLGVEVRTGIPVRSIDEEGVQLGGERIAARTVLWAAGVAASPLARSFGVELDRSGRVPVSPDLRAPGFDNVYVAGDLASLQQDGKPVPGVAPAAKQMGAHVAHAILARLAGRDAASFRYRDYGNLATIGRMAAVVHLGKLKLSGALAWWFWLLAHVFFLIGFRNRLVVMLNWTWAYWTYQRAARIILGRDEAS